MRIFLCVRIVAEVILLGYILRPKLFFEVMDFIQRTIRNDDNKQNQYYNGYEKYSSGTKKTKRNVS